MIVDNLPLSNGCLFSQWFCQGLQRVPHHLHLVRWDLAVGRGGPQNVYSRTNDFFFACATLS